MSLVNIRAALENALAAIPSIIPAVTISTSASGTSAVFTTSTAHNLVSGLDVTIAGHSGSTPSLNGRYFVTVLSATTFSLTNKVTKAAIASTVGGTGGTVSANLTAWEAVGFAPVAGVAFQKVNLVMGKPENPSYGDAHSREIGFLQVALFYPIQYGTSAAMARAELIRSYFQRGASFSHGGITVHIPGKAEIMSGLVQDENYIVVIRIPYWSDIFA
jgi:hypothetical protein